MTGDPLICVCGQPKQAHESKCLKCMWDETPAAPDDALIIDAPPARDYPTSFPEGAD